MSDYDNRNKDEVIHYLEERCKALRRELDAANEVIARISRIVEVAQKQLFYGTSTAAVNEKP